MPVHVQKSDRMVSVYLADCQVLTSAIGKRDSLFCSLQERSRLTTLCLDTWLEHPGNCCRRTACFGNRVIMTRASLTARFKHKCINHEGGDFVISCAVVTARNCCFGSKLDSDTPGRSYVLILMIGSDG